VARNFVYEKKIVWKLSFFSNYYSETYNIGVKIDGIVSGGNSYRKID